MSIDAGERKQPRGFTVGAIVFIAVALTAGLYLGWERGYFGTSADRPVQTAATAQSDGAPTGKSATPKAASNETGAARKSTEKADGTMARNATASLSKSVAPTASNEPAPPRFDVVRISKDRVAVMAGRAPVGARVTLFDGDVPLAEVDVDARGEWAVVLDRPLTGGTKRLHLSARLPDGQRIASLAPVLVIIPETDNSADSAAAATSGPIVVQLPTGTGKSSRLLQSPVASRGGNALSLDAVDYDQDGNVVISGSAPQGHSVRLYLDDRPIGSVVSGERRLWSLLPMAPIAPGNYALRLDHVGADGKVVARIEVPFTRVDASRVTRLTPGDRVVVQPGNNLWRIARRTYGRGVLYSIIYQANSNQIRDPDLIYPGQIFTLPETTH